MLKNFIQKEKERLRSDTPKIYKRISWFCGIVSGLCVAGLTATSAINAELPQTFKYIISYSIFISAALAWLTGRQTINKK